MAASIVGSRFTSQLSRVIFRSSSSALTPGSPSVVVSDLVSGDGVDDSYVSLLVAVSGFDPVASIRTIFWDPLFGPAAGYSRPQLLVKAGPLILIACGLALGFRAGIWNIGAEGQYIIGGICGAAVALAADPLDAFWIFPAMILGGALCGWAWGMIPAMLRNWFGASEILVSLMLVYVAQRIAAWMAFGPMRNPQGMGFPGSRNLQQYPSAANPELIAGTGAHWGVVAAAAAVLATWFLMSRHIRGFHIRAAGTAPRAARFAGVRPASSDDTYAVVRLKPVTVPRSVSAGRKVRP